VECLDFGCCPQKSLISRMLVIVNYTSEFVLNYSWGTRELFPRSDNMQFEPQMGELAPGSHQVVIVRLYSEEPLAVAGEVECALEWTHISAYGDVQETAEQSTDLGTQEEYLAFHSSHVHEPAFSNKDAACRALPHVSVANRLTVSRFRNLMSTAAGQKFLNENLHRTALLSSHIPNAQTAARSSQGTVAGTMSGAHPLALMQQGGAGAQGMGSTVGTDLGGTGGSQTGPSSPPPSTNPMYVRIKAIVADWEAPEKSTREEYLICEQPGVVPEEEEPPSTVVSPSPAPGAPGDDPQAAALKLPIGVAANVMEAVLRDIMSGTDMRSLLDEMVKQDAPFFVQFEDSHAPGEGPPPAMMEPVRPPEPQVQKTDAELEAAGEKLVAQEEDVAPVVGPGWSSAVLCDFSGCKPRPVKKPPWEQEEEEEEDDGDVFAAMDEEGGEDQLRRMSSMSRTKPENPELLWDKALELGEVDLDAFRAGAAQALEDVLLTSIDDVISGRFNWTKPLPPGMAQARRLSSMEVQ